MTDETIQTEQPEAAPEAPESPKAKRGPRKSEGMVKVRITKAGDGKVFTGESDNKTFARNETPSLPQAVAEALEARGLAEID